MVLQEAVDQEGVRLPPTAKCSDFALQGLGEFGIAAFQSFLCPSLREEQLKQFLL
jgi:hypothetical protein